MNVVMIIPTGIGCKIGGDCGDANPAAKLLASCCDTLIVHPNVVNASDVNEMTENCLYVEGSMLDRFLRGEIYLHRVHSNKVLVVINPVNDEDSAELLGFYDAVNASSAARATIGLDAEVVELETPLELIAQMEDNVAAGKVHGWQELVKQVEEYTFDALAIATEITIKEEILKEYFLHGGTNPVGGVEAIASKLISAALDKPVAHGPVIYSLRSFTQIVNPTMAVELVTTNFIHCILKGLHRAPRINYDRGMSVDEIDYMVSPIGCYGPPHEACVENDIPIIVVRENTCVLNKEIPDAIFVDNYIEAAGLLMAIRAGISPSSVRRPLERTKVHRVMK